MHHNVPSYIQNLKPYTPGKSIEELAREKNLSFISKLSSNENPLGPSPYAIKEITQTIWNIHRYPDSSARSLKSKISDYWDLGKENIILGNGSEGVMTNILRTFTQPGDEVLTSKNTFIGFYIMAKSLGLKIHTAPLNSHYQYDVNTLKENITKKIKIIYIANPNNPTGTYITKNEFDYLMEYVPKSCIVILDEAYFEFSCQHKNYPDSMDYRYDNIITTRTFSKAYGLSGIRIGYGFAHENIISYLMKIKLPFEPNTIAQAGAIGALDDQPHLKRTISSNQKFYEKTYSFLQNNDFKPIKSITNFITFNAGNSESSQAMYETLLNEGVIIRPLNNQDMPGFVRVSIGSEEEMNHYFNSMEKILPKWKKSYGRFL